MQLGTLKCTVEKMKVSRLSAAFSLIAAPAAWAKILYAGVNEVNAMPLLLVYSTYIYFFSLAVNLVCSPRPQPQEPVCQVGLVLTSPSSTQ